MCVRAREKERKRERLLYERVSVRKDKDKKNLLIKKRSGFIDENYPENAAQLLFIQSYISESCIANERVLTLQFVTIKRRECTSRPVKVSNRMRLNIK